MIIPVDSQVSSMNEIFHRDAFIIPSYQRDYSWKPQQIEDFWGDLMNLYNEKENSHFFGQIVVHSKGDYERLYEIIDGQQRITTSYIFSSVIRDVADLIIQKNKQMGGKLKDYLDDIKKECNDLVEAGPMSDINNRYSLILQNNESRNYFEHDILQKSTKIKKNTSNLNEVSKNMNKAYFDLKKCVINSFPESNAENKITVRAKFLKNILRMFENRFFVSMLYTQNNQDAFNIFTTLNARGKTLEVSDLVKTYLMSLTNNNDDELSLLKNKWDAVSNILNNDSSTLSSFIRSYWSASSELVSKEKLYRSITPNITNINKAKTFTNDLYSLVDIYKKMNFNSTNDKYKFNNNKLNSLFRILNNLNFKLYYPIVLSMYHNIEDPDTANTFNESDIILVVRKIISVYMRLHVISQNVTRDLEKGCAKIAEEIWENDGSISVDDIRIKLNQYNLNNDIVKNSFDNINVNKPLSSKGGKNKYALKYLLFNLMCDDDEALNNPDMNNIELLKIPNSPDINNIGVCTLLESDIANSDFNNKEKLKQSNLDINQHILQRIENNGEWDNDDVVKFKNELVNRAITLWSY